MARSRLRRVSGARKALLRSLVTALFQYGRITTTESKAKELRHVADKMISLAKRGDLHARRQALQVAQPPAFHYHIAVDFPIDCFPEICSSIHELR